MKTSCLVPCSPAQPTNSACSRGLWPPGQRPPSRGYCRDALPGRRTAAHIQGLALTPFQELNDAPHRWVESWRRRSSFWETIKLVKWCNTIWKSRNIWKNIYQWKTEDGREDVQQDFIRCSFPLRPSQRCPVPVEDCAKVSGGPCVSLQHNGQHLWMRRLAFFFFLSLFPFSLASTLSDCPS